MDSLRADFAANPIQNAIIHIDGISKHKGHKPLAYASFMFIQIKLPHCFLSSLLRSLQRNTRFNTCRCIQSLLMNSSQYIDPLARMSTHYIKQIREKNNASASQ